MTAISDFAASQETFNSAIDSSVSDLKSEVQAMLDLITQLQSSSSISAEDQASLDALSAHSKTLSDSLSALDSLAKPVAPSAPVAPVDGDNGNTPASNA